MKLNNYSLTFRARKLINSLSTRLHNLEALVNPTIEIFSQIDQLKNKFNNFLVTQMSNYLESVGAVTKVIHSEPVQNKDKATGEVATQFIDNSLINLEKYSARELDLLRLIYADCVFRCALTSSSFKTSMIADTLGLKPQSLRNLLSSVVKKNDIVVKNIQKGRGHFRVFEMSRELYQSLTEDSFRSVKFNSNISANGNFNSNSNSNCSAYSSSYIYKLKKKEDNNISTQNPRARASLYAKKIKVVIPEDSPDPFSDIDIAPLAQIGFTKKHVKQIKLFQTPEELQESINHFAWALEHGKAKKKYGDPLNVFMGVMRKGNAWVEKDYETPEQIRERLLQKDIENSKKLQEPKREEENTVDEFTKQDFAVWESNLTPEEKKSMIPATVLAHPLKAAATDYLKRFYRDNILQTRILMGELQYAS